MLSTSNRRSHRRSQHGLSLVELLVGIVVSLLVVAATSLMVSNQLADNRKLLLETQLQQDLRAAADIITRELRRASYLPDTTKDKVWFEGRTADIVENTAFGTITPPSGLATQVEFKYRKRSGDEGPYGFKLETEALKSKIGPEWQVLTDANVVRITAFSIDIATPKTYQLPCPKLCPDGSQDCWPALWVRTATISLTGQSRLDPSVVRSFTTQTRIRNDWMHFNGAAVCPA